jgi:hypothetical protein
VDGRSQIGGSPRPSRWSLRDGGLGEAEGRQATPSPRSAVKHRVQQSMVGWAMAAGCAAKLPSRGDGSRIHAEKRPRQLGCRSDKRARDAEYTLALRFVKSFLIDLRSISASFASRADLRR